MNEFYDSERECSALLYLFYHESPIIYYVGITVIYKLCPFKIYEEIGPADICILIEKITHKPRKVLSSAFCLSPLAAYFWQGYFITEAAGKGKLFKQTRVNDISYKQTSVFWQWHQK